MIENGQFALIHYTGTLANGEVFDTTEGREPFEFEIGGGFVIPAFEDAIKAMAVNDEKEIFIKSEDAYGNHNPEMTQTVPIDDVKQHLTPEKGMVIQVMLSNGQHTPARISDVTAENVILDFNHPLAGEDLNFKLKLVGINDEATMKEECGCGDDCGCDGEDCGSEKEGCGSDKGGCGCGCN